MAGQSRIVSSPNILDLTLGCLENMLIGWVVCKLHQVDTCSLKIR